MCVVTTGIVWSKPRTQGKLQSPQCRDETQRHGKALLWSIMWMLTVHVENAHHSLCPLGSYGLKTTPLQRLLLQSSKACPHVQLYIVTLPCRLLNVATPPCSALSNNPAAVPLHGNHAELPGCWSFPSRILPNPNLLHTCL